MHDELMMLLPLLLPVLLQHHYILVDAVSAFGTYAIVASIYTAYSVVPMHTVQVEYATQPVNKPCAVCMRFKQCTQCMLFM